MLLIIGWPHDGGIGETLYTISRFHPTRLAICSFVGFSLVRGVAFFFMPTVSLKKRVVLLMAEIPNNHRLDGAETL